MKGLFASLKRRIRICLRSRRNRKMPNKITTIQKVSFMNPGQACDQNDKGQQKGYYRLSSAFAFLLTALSTYILSSAFRIVSSRSAPSLRIA